MVRKKTLLIIASIVWLLAGFNIIKIGLMTYAPYINVINILLSFVIFGLFWFMVFQKLVNKHTIRIQSFEMEKQWFWKFFDLKSFMIMFFMMTFGILIRSYHLLPDVFIAVFYSGLGSALFLAGVLFGKNYLCFIFE